MLPAYVVHCMEGRARLRHPALGEVAVRAAAQNALGKEQGVDEVRSGAESLLLFLQPGVNVAGICKRLEASVPMLARPQAEVVQALPPVPADAKNGAVTMLPMPLLHPAQPFAGRVTGVMFWVFRAASLRCGP